MAKKEVTPDEELQTASPFRRHGFAALVACGETVLDAVSQGMAMALAMHRDERRSIAGISRLANFFCDRLDAQWLRTQVKEDHLTQGLATAWGKVDAKGISIFVSDQTRLNQTPRPRLIDLIILHCEEAEDQALRTRSSRSGPHTLIPSPALIAMCAMTSPDDPATQAYALLAIRTVLCRRFKVWPVISEFQHDVPDGFEAIGESRIMKEIGAVNTFLDHRDNRSTLDPIKQFVAHFLAARGMLHLRLKDDAHAIEYLKTGHFAPVENRDSERWGKWPEYRLSDRYPRLPGAASFINEMIGIPLPIRGADTVFFNGLKFSANIGLGDSTLSRDEPKGKDTAPSKSLVIGVSGAPGTGKTSLGLALGAALSPLDTQTVYITFEEDERDLTTKLVTLHQLKLERLSYSHKGLDWFIPCRLSGLDLADFESRVLGELQKRNRLYNQLINESNGDRTLAPPVPMLVVVDSISAVWMEGGGEDSKEYSGATLESSRGGKKEKSSAIRRKRLEDFVNRCRNLGALVILLSAAKSEFSGILEYLVDVVITLHVENGTDHTQKPLRTFTLSKSRHQMARHGTHVLHLSKESGFRIAPQLPSQIDSRHALRHLLWDQETFLDVLNVHRSPESVLDRTELLRLHTRSQILIHGRGSSGKAGLALKIALAARFTANGFSTEQSYPRVLIVSFLYPEEYYETLRKRIIQRQPNEIERSVQDLGRGPTDVDARTGRQVKPTYLYFAPGFLAAEDLYSKLVRALDAARLEGFPYSVVAIDGLHNLALQFPGARESEVLWPIVFGTLVRSNVTTISTFTTLSLNTRQFNRETSLDAQEDSVFRLRTHLPLLHAMVQASDYVMELERPSDAADYNIQILSAINAEPPRGTLKWDRKNLEFGGYIPAGHDSNPKIAAG